MNITCFARIVRIRNGLFALDSLINFLKFISSSYFLDIRGGLMKIQKVVPLGLWIIIGIMISIGAASIKIGSLNHPGPGLFPLLVGCLIILLSSLQLIIELLSSSNSEKTISHWPHKNGLKRVIAVLVLLICYMALLKYLGFLLCTFIFLIALLRFVDKKNWKYTIVSSLTISALSYLFFKVLLKINLPLGLLGV
jgi:putative tricarboxylic transport membrane protein